MEFGLIYVIRFVNCAVKLNLSLVGFNLLELELEVEVELVLVSAELAAACWGIQEKPYTLKTSGLPDFMK
jgi:hypothetical protein